MVGATHGLRKSYVLSPLFHSMFFAVALHVVLVCFSEDEGIVQNLVHRDDDGAGRVENLLVCARRAEWGTLFANDAGVVSKSAQGLVSPLSK